MLKYKFDILKALKEAGYNTGKIRRERVFSESTLSFFRKGKIPESPILDRLCKLLGCQPGDILEYVPDQETE